MQLALTLSVKTLLQLQPQFRIKVEIGRVIGASASAGVAVAKAPGMATPSWYSCAVMAVAAVGDTVSETLTSKYPES